MWQAGLVKQADIRRKRGGRQRTYHKTPSNRQAHLSQDTTERQVALLS